MLHTLRHKLLNATNELDQCVNQGNLHVRFLSPEILFSFLMSTVLSNYSISTILFLILLLQHEIRYTFAFLSYAILEAVLECFIHFMTK